MVLDGGMRQHQTDAHALRVGAERGMACCFHTRGVKARPAVAHGDDDHAVLALGVELHRHVRVPHAPPEGE